jgi:flagellar biosynthesis/type III secretory pathway protein FliH
MGEFISLDRYVRMEPAEAQVTLASEAPARVDPSEDVREVLRDVRRFYAALRDAFDAAREELLRDLAADVLARELACAPVEIERIAARALERVRDEEPLRILAHPDDVTALGGLGLPVVAKMRLRRGDLQLVIRHGTIDVSLGVRLAHLLEAR